MVGCGGISERHARAAAATAAASIVACCDVRVEVAEAWGRRHGCERAFGDYRTMVREHELDGVLLATWPNLHREQVLGCLKAGVRNILCEKALALTGAEALEISTAAAEADALVVEGYMYRHHPAIQTIDGLLAAGEAGKIDSISATFNMFDPEESSPYDPGRDWRQRTECSGGVPYDLACYCVDACNRFARTLPRQAHAVGGTSDRYGTVDRLYGLIEYEDGLVGVLESSRRSDSNHELRISGAQGHVRLPVAWRIEGPTEVLLSRSVGWGEFETRRLPLPAVDPFRLQLESFAAAVRGDSPPQPALAESVVGAFTMDALLTSAAERAVVPVELPTALGT
ncbi:MAG: Gfo/Idh/MocA family protein [Gaiellaceae bacterium]